MTMNDTLLCVDTGLHVIRELTKDGGWIRDLGNLGIPSDSGFEKDVWRRMQRRGKIEMCIRDRVNGVHAVNCKMNLLRAMERDKGDAVMGSQFLCPGRGGSGMDR